MTVFSCVPFLFLSPNTPSSNNGVFFLDWIKNMNSVRDVLHTVTSPLKQFYMMLDQKEGKSNEIRDLEPDFAS